MSDPLECIRCAKCGKSEMTSDWYRLDHKDDDDYFCSRRCLVEFIAPELSKAVCVKQWVPTEDEIARMSQ